ncbi:hypothetical protein Y032_0241g3374 [Ancylostoma ceylanicum]|uniref:Uncharacterized protein n=1 Tax=Ancylostoma ceylanicum TaxID=53326 RepID=A0A016SDN5_9BILA|nr:hypothetical protein Y032_0241g3374 [Ancylostoma ceylanicum]
MPTGVSQYAEHEYDNHFGRRHRSFDFIDFFHFRSGRARTCLPGFSDALSTNMTTTLGYDIDVLILSFFPLSLGDEQGHVL